MKQVFVRVKSEIMGDMLALGLGLIVASAFKFTGIL